LKRSFFKIYGWLVIRPIRWFFWKMICNTALCVVPKREWGQWRLPNIHWWLLYKTIFKFFKWLNYDAWRPFCDWTGGWRQSYPLPARVIHTIGKTTAGYAISGGQCYHCGSEEGDPVTLSEDDTGEYFELLETWKESTMDGIDYRFRGITTCPKCGFKEEYEDGSL
jgi:hypothetical protein